MATSVGNALDRVVFVQHMLTFAPHSAKRISALAYVSSTFFDTIVNYGEGLFDVWRCRDRLNFEREFFRLCAELKDPTTDLRLPQQMLAAGVSPNLLGWPILDKPPPADGSSLMPVLTMVAVTGRICLLNALISAGANVDIVATNMGNSTPLLLAATKGVVASVKALVAAGANVGLKDVTGADALFMAVRKGQHKCVSVLLGGKGADPNTTEPSGGAPAISIGASLGHLECVKALVAAPGIKINACDSKGASALYNASQEGHLAVVEALLAVDGIDVDKRTTSGFTPLAGAMFDGHVEIISKLLAAGANVNSVTDQGRTPMCIAAENGQPRSIEVLIAAGGEVGCVDTSGWNALMFAADKNHAKCIDVLAATGQVNIDAVAHDGYSALMTAAREGSAEAVAALLRLNPNVHIATPKGETALMLAADAGDGPGFVKSIEALLAAGARVEAKLKQQYVGATAIWLAAQKGHAKACAALLKAGADPNVSVIDNDPSTRGKFGWSPLHGAAGRSAECVKVLLQGGAEVDKRGGEFDWTPLFSAATSGRTDCARLLLDAGASRYAKGNCMMHPRDHARLKGHMALATLLDADDLDNEDRMELAEKNRAGGNTAFGLGQFERAIGIYRKALEALEPVKISARDGPGAAAKLSNSRLACYSNTALCYLKLGKFRDAQVAANRAVRIDDGNLKAVFRRGQASVGIGKLDDAERDFKRCLELDPENVDAKAQLDAVLEKKQSK